MAVHQHTPFPTVRLPAALGTTNVGRRAILGAIPFGAAAALAAAPPPASPVAPAVIPGGVDAELIALADECVSLLVDCERIATPWAYTTSNMPAVVQTRMDDLGAREGAAWSRLKQMWPTTMQGIAALARLQGISFECSYEGDVVIDDGDPIAFMIATELGAITIAEAMGRRGSRRAEDHPAAPPPRDAGAAAYVSEMHRIPVGAEMGPHMAGMRAAILAALMAESAAA